MRPDIVRRKIDRGRRGGFVAARRRRYERRVKKKKKTNSSVCRRNGVRSPVNAVNPPRRELCKINAGGGATRAQHRPLRGRGVNDLGRREPIMTNDYFFRGEVVQKWMLCLPAE